MSETTGELQAHIRDTRENLKADIDELEQKVKSATDWRQHYEKSPGLFLAAALGGGLLVALATHSRRPRAVAALPVPPQVPAARPKGGDDSMGVIKSALIGLAASHAKDALTALLPGFQAQLAEREKSYQRPVADSMPPPPGNRESMQ